MPSDNGWGVDSDMLALPLVGFIVGLALLVASLPMILHPNEKPRLLWESPAPVGSRS